MSHADQCNAVIFAGLLVCAAIVLVPFSLVAFWHDRRVRKREAGSTLDGIWPR